MDFPFDVTAIKIDTSRLTLRAFTEGDIDDMYEYASVPGVGEMAGWKHHASKEVTAGIIQRFLQNKDVFALYHKADAKVIGALGVHNAWINRQDIFAHLKAKNIGYTLSKAYWGLGLMPEAVAAIIEYGRDKLALDAFTIEHFVTNLQSKRVIEKSGFEYIRDGAYYSQELDKHFDERRYILPFTDRAHTAISEYRQSIWDDVAGE